jgi:hypothetical protein
MSVPDFELVMDIVQVIAFAVEDQKKVNFIPPGALLFCSDVLVQ